MAGLALACGGASALNHVLDRDIDPLMGERTKRGRSPPAASPPSRALEFGLALLAFSFVLLASAVNVLTAVLALAGGLFYVIVYTRWLKRSTPQNIVIGGAAGAVPPLVGWAAATGHLGVPALAPLRDRLRLDAAALLGARAADQGQLRGRAGADAPGRARRPRDGAADRPLLGRARRRDAAARGRWGAPARPTSSCALALGAVFVGMAERLRRDTTPRRAMLLFHYSLLYLALIFAALALDSVILMDPGDSHARTSASAGSCSRSSCCSSPAHRDRVPVPRTSTS